MSTNWGVRLELEAGREGLDPEALADQLKRWFTAQEVDALPQLTVTDAGPAETVGANFTLAATTPGQALDEAERLLRQAAGAHTIPVGPLAEAVVERLDGD